jgi:hypothetical protein
MTASAIGVAQPMAALDETTSPRVDGTIGHAIGASVEGSGSTIEVHPPTPERYDHASGGNSADNVAPTASPPPPSGTATVELLAALSPVLELLDVERAGRTVSAGASIGTTLVPNSAAETVPFEPVT